MNIIFTHWGAIQIANNEWATNACFNTDGSIERIDLEAPFHLYSPLPKYHSYIKDGYEWMPWQIDRTKPPTSWVGYPVST